MKRQFLGNMHSLMPVEYFMCLFMNDFLPGCLFAVVEILRCFKMRVNV